jgi:hypothetical protein
MRRLTPTLVVLLVGLGFCYLVLPGLVEEQLAMRLQERLGLATEPDVEVSSSFPPELLLGRIDRVRVSADEATLQGISLGGARADLTNVEVSLPDLLQGQTTVEAQGCSLSAATPALSVDDDAECLSYLGLSGG